MFGRCLAASVVMLVFALTKGRLSRSEGLALLLCYSVSWRYDRSVALGPRHTGIGCGPQADQARGARGEEAGVTGAMSRILGGGVAWRVSMRAAAFLVAAGAATGLPAELGFGGAAAAQERPAPSEAALGGAEGAAPEGALAELFEMARSGQADRHLPFVLARLKRALADQDLLGVLELTDKSYFDAQFQRHRTPNRSPGQAMSAYACESSPSATSPRPTASTTSSRRRSCPSRRGRADRRTGRGDLGVADVGRSDSRQRDFLRSELGEDLRLRRLTDQRGSRRPATNRPAATMIATPIQVSGRRVFRGRPASRGRRRR